MIQGKVYKIRNHSGRYKKDMKKRERECDKERERGRERERRREEREGESDIFVQRNPWVTLI